MTTMLQAPPLCRGKIIRLARRADVFWTEAEKEN